MSILKPQSFDIAHYYATRPKYKYYNSNILRMFLSDAKEWKPLRPMPAPEEAHSIPTYIVKIQERFMQVIFNRIIHNNKGVWYE